MRYLIAIACATLVFAAGKVASEGAVAEGDTSKMPSYTLERASEKPKQDGDWEGAASKNVPALDVVHFYRTDLSDHRAKAEAKPVFDDLGIYVHFRVEDRYVRSKIGTGPYSFKKNWGFEPQPLHYEYCLYKLDSIPQNNPNNAKYKLFIAAWRRMPIGLANLLGPHIVRNLG